MSDVRYVLRSTKAAGKTAIMLSFQYGKERLRLSTGLCVKVKDWDFNAQRFLKTKDSIDVDNLNFFLDLLSTQVINKYNEWLVQRNLPTLVEFKAYVQQQFLLENKKEPQSYLWLLFDEFVAEKKDFVKDVTDYDKALRKHLKKAEELYGQELTFDAIKQRTNGFVHFFERYMATHAKGIENREGLSINTIGKQLKNLKVFLHWCFDNSRISLFSLSHIVSCTEEVDATYLTSAELQLLEDLPLDEELSKVRDLFLIGCETGLRYSDFCSLQAGQILGNNLEVIPIKTRKKTATSQQVLVIPISKRCKKIFKKYNNNLPSFGHNQLNYFNSSLKQICREAGINKVISINRTRQQSLQSEQFEKWEVISSHTARRTFCTLKFLAGMPSESIMKFSGHTSERNFLKYLRIDNQLNADHFRKFF
jgi:integrase